ncbi:DUF2924 domain-containing protein [Roseovarius rhodophyticola]|uniref:DUF2924 domain-containing protein n=1 Tax=Roseovarius rhodophyticola TaxID=3080827 RepID=A0ABZ2TGU3_9RHOB|nr:DUF2924 domain-containing protein [Roseovarius sp. W115]MDV2928777.1 DUF2924 domain-containing protein [Roseovarius sp. W115]
MAKPTRLFPLHNNAEFHSGQNWTSARRRAVVFVPLMPPGNTGLHSVPGEGLAFAERVETKTTIETKRRLKQIAAGNLVPTVAKPGSHLVREWNGKTYQVEVMDSGFVMDGKTWRSLSAVARHITGARWSGPGFFGVQ